MPYALSHGAWAERGDTAWPRYYSEATVASDKACGLGV
jgi:hypothetical protein